MIIKYHVKNPARTQGYLNCNCGTKKKKQARVFKDNKGEFTLIEITCSRCFRTLFDNRLKNENP